jgi:SAM-dependent methyltransferase
VSRYTHGHHEAVLRSHRWRTVDNSAAYLIPYLSPGSAVLDVGCGPGTITSDIARRVAPGAVIGIDRSPDAIEAARVSESTIDYRTGDVYALEFADGAFDIVHAHQVLQHLSDPVAALREMRRVCRGVVAARDGDYEAMTWFPADPLLDRWLQLYRDVARANGGEPDAGRHLLGWAHAAGFGEVTATASAWCFATAEDRQWWGETWAQRVSETELASRAIGLGLASSEELAAMAAAWLRWAGDPEGWFAVLHGEVICRP